MKILNLLFGLVWMVRNVFPVSLDCLDIALQTAPCLLTLGNFCEVSHLPTLSTLSYLVTHG